MNAFWIIVADENRGRVFAAETRNSELEELESLVHPESKLPERELASDAPGRNRSANTGGHSVNDSGDIHRHHSQLFAKQVAQTLKQGLEQKRFRYLALVAAPKFLGMLRKEIDSNLERHICFVLNKDLTKLKAHELRKHLPKRLPINI